MPTMLVLVAVSLVLAAHASGQLGPVPFESCTATSPAVFSLTIERAPWANGSVRVATHLKNVSASDAVVDLGEPDRMFAARVVDATGNPVDLTSEGRSLYSSSPNSVYVGGGRAIGPRHLEPQEEITDTWPISDKFDVAKLGSYEIRVEANVWPFKTTVCSNTITVEIR